MTKRAALELFAKAKQNLNSDYDNIIRLIEETQNTDVGIFLEKILEWTADWDPSGGAEGVRPQLVWEIFHTTINMDPLSFLGSLVSFVGNCLLDDSYFSIEWRKPDYKHVTKVYAGTEFKVIEIQWLPNGEIKTMLTTKDDPNGKPVVIRALDDNGSQNAKLLIEAMDIAESRELARRAELIEALRKE